MFHAMMIHHVTIHRAQRHSYRPLIMISHAMMIHHITIHWTGRDFLQFILIRRWMLFVFISHSRVHSVLQSVGPSELQASPCSSGSFAVAQSALQITGRNHGDKRKQNQGLSFPYFVTTMYGHTCIRIPWPHVYPNAWWSLECATGQRSLVVSHLSADYVDNINDFIHQLLQ